LPSTTNPHDLLLREHITIDHKFDHCGGAPGFRAMTLAPYSGIGPLLRLMQYARRVKSLTEIGPGSAQR
jgi:hypothetical protein